MAAVTCARFVVSTNSTSSPHETANLREPLANAPVENPRDEDVIPGQERLKDGRCRRAAGGEEHARDATLQGCEQPLGVVVGRIVGARVRQAGPVAPVGATLVYRR